MSDDAYFLRKIADEYFGDKKDDCHECLNLAADEIVRLRKEVGGQQKAMAHLTNGLLQVVASLRQADGKVFARAINEITKHIDEAREFLPTKELP